MTRKDEIEMLVRRTLREVLGAARADDAFAAADLAGDGFLDSYALVELAVRLEEASGLDLMSAHMNEDTFRSGASLVALIETLEAEGA